MADERERLNELTAAAERGDAQAKYNYANELYKAAEGGLVKAQRELGIILRDGNGIPKNDKEAVQWFRKAAEQDDRDAQWALGVMLRDGGVGIQKNPQEAAEWFRKALASRDPAKWWHPTKQLEFGIMLRDGNGIPKNDKEATEWLEKTAEHFRMVAEQYNDWSSPRSVDDLRLGTQAVHCGRCGFSVGHILLS